MVATALTVQSQREMVMDFTHPYYYEFSSILVKKSNPSETRWTKLLDPFSSTVFLFVGISVPACSFLIFFFEKYNPFYGKVIQRRKTRGLHHFSDSFYYMYGALLTHGKRNITMYLKIFSESKVLNIISLLFVFICHVCYNFKIV